MQTDNGTEDERIGISACFGMTKTQFELRFSRTESGSEAIRYYRIMSFTARSLFTWIKWKVRSSPADIDIALLYTFLPFNENKRSYVV